MADKAKYAEALDALISNLQNIKDYMNQGETQKVLEEICVLLRIGRIEMKYFQTRASEMKGDALSMVMYDCGHADDNPDLENKVREPIESGAISHHVFSPIAGESSWTQDEVDKMSTVASLLHVYFGRSVLVNVIEELTFNDNALEIPNLSFFIKKAGEMFGRGIIDDYGVVYFNLRRFSVVNNQVGRNEGTAIMKKYVHGLKDLYSDDECVCRIGGDNFVSLFRKEHLDMVKEYLSGVKIRSDNRYANFTVSAYGGFYMINAAECNSPIDLMDRAAVVVNIAKRGGGSPLVFYNEQIQENVRMSKKIEDMIPDALVNHEFLVYYQPKVSMKDYTLVGAEALCRWQHDGEMIQPFRFIPVLERSKLICELDYYMLDHVCQDIRRWIDMGKKIVKISVNFSRMHLGDANLLEDILSIINKYQIPHEYIEIELTETTTDVDYEELKRVVTGLRDSGISTAVDDFGMGYSSLNLIRELPWNVLKIDKSFLPDGSGNEKQEKTMLKYVIAMAQELGLECIVEGVETMEHVMLLKENSCYLAQGFYFDKPLPVQVFETRLE